MGYNQSNLLDFGFHDVPLAIFERDKDGIIQWLEDLRPTAHIFCAHQTPRLVDKDVVKFAGHAGQSEQLDG